MPRQISSRDNDKIKSICKLRDVYAFRQEEKSFLAEGLKLCRDLCEALPVKEIYITDKALAEFPKAEALCQDCYIIAPHVAEKLASTRENQGVFCVFSLPEPAIISKGRWLALENVQDPGNVGAALRAAAAFGFSGAILSRGCADAFSPKALRASMGACARLPLVTNADFPDIIQEIKAAGNTAYAAALLNSVPLSEASPKDGVCVVIGSEGQGLTQASIAACDMAVRIPISNMVESLNAAMAAGVLMWHFREGEQ